MAIATVADIIRVHGRERPDARALEYEGRSITFGDLDVASSRLANAWASIGVGAGDRVAFLDKNGPEYFEAAFAAAKLNAVTVAVNWRLAPVEIAQIVNDARATLLVVGAEFAAHVEEIEADLETVSTIVSIGEHPRWSSYDAMVGHGDATDPGARARSDDVAWQMYTSGTTGLPKGVMLTNHNFFAGMVRASDRWGLTSGSVCIAAMPMFHIGGSGCAMVGLYHGARTVLMREFDAARVLQLIPEFGVTQGLFVPAMIQALLLNPGVTDADISTLAVILYGASPISDTVLIRAMEVLGCDFIGMYGLTETAGSIVQLDAADHDPVGRPALLRSCGKPFPWVDVRIVGAATGDDVADGEVGELWVRSAQNMAGYWANPTATEVTVTDDGWLKTGDAGYRDPDGFLFLHDRVKDMIVSGAENIYPAEVENAIAKHPDVVDVAVVGVPDDRWGEVVKAVVVRAEGSTITGDEIITFARGYLGGFKLPKSVDFADELPRNPSGKLLKREIRAPYWAGRERQIG